MRDRVSEGWERASVKIDQAFDVAKPTTVNKLDQLSTSLNTMEMQLLNVGVDLGTNLYGINVSPKDITYRRLSNTSDILSTIYIGDNFYRFFYKDEMTAYQFGHETAVTAITLFTPPGISLSVNWADYIYDIYVSSGESYWQNISRNPKILYY